MALKEPPSEVEGIAGCQCHPSLEAASASAPGQCHIEATAGLGFLPLRLAFQVLPGASSESGCQYPQAAASATGGGWYLVVTYY